MEKMKLQFGKVILARTVSADLDGSMSASTICWSLQSVRDRLPLTGKIYTRGERSENRDVRHGRLRPLTEGLTVM